MEELACKNCRIIISHGDTCPLCGSTDLTSRWNGYVIMLNADKSDIAKKLGLKVNSVFALNVKE
ncbi:DNA-directed RNA polymerase subunit E'' [Candidatus Marsarchaeota archaeon]|nr:DNA-directed RNA polymerase subunit E'' [Candidatus Marsarchaeota archaeon]